MGIRSKIYTYVAVGLSISTVSSTAIASSVALSLNEITGFSMSSAGVSFTDFTFSNDAAATESGGTGGADMMDAPAACVGDCAGWQNQFYAHSPSSTEFSYGDARITSTDILNGNGAASSIGEAVANDGIAFASGSNTLISLYLSVVDATQLSFNFTADALMQTSVSGPGMSSAANIDFSISLTNASDMVFSWSPDGEAGGVIGGTELADAFNLNYGITGNTLYNPASGLFGASTNALAAGAYTLNIKMGNQVDAAVVPVPAAAWLFGSGLVGLAGFARRKQL